LDEPKRLRKPEKHGHPEMAFEPLRDRSKSARSVVRDRSLTYFDHSRIHFGLCNFIILNERTSALLQAAPRAQKTLVAHLHSITAHSANKQYPAFRANHGFCEVRFGSHCGLKSDSAPSPKSADSVAKVPKCAATNFPLKDETSDNRRTM
jgi:hypothetical protein